MINLEQVKHYCPKHFKEIENYEEAINDKRKTWSEFGDKFKEHFGITFSDNKKLYLREHKWYLNHNKVCRWEV